MLLLEPLELCNELSNFVAVKRQEIGDEMRKPQMGRQEYDSSAVRKSFLQMLKSVDRPAVRAAEPRKMR
jgi:hypothetical protein